MLVPVILLIKNVLFDGYGLLSVVAPNLFVVLIALIISVPGANILTPGPASELTAFCSKPPLCIVLSTLPTT